MTAEIRVGQGVDTHRLVAGRPLILGGVNIPSPLGLDGHSDADAVLHAAVDALLGAAGKGDIGTYFPNSDPRWKNADSRQFVRHAISELGADGWSVVNVDINILIETPRIAPFVGRMKEILAQDCGIEPDRVAVKAGTTEGLGFTGRSEGVVALCTVLISRQ